MKILAFLIAFVLFIGGLLLMGYSFTPNGFDGPIFIGGILAAALAVFIPFSILKWIDRA
jgi:hypothetical protein